MPHVDPRRFIPILAATVLLSIAAVAAALPPARAPDHTSVYRHTTKRVRDGKEQTRVETMTISVGGVRSRWQRQRDGQTTIFDREKKTMIMWGGEIEPKMALQHRLDQPRSDWEFGYAMIASDGPAPQEGGSATIAGQPCTILKFETKRFGSLDLCVTAQGIVSRLVLDDKEAGVHTTFEAEKISPGAVAPDSFLVPKDLELFE